MSRLKKSMSRRTLIRTSAATISLPFLESMLPRTLAAKTKADAQARRYITCYVPNGVLESSWFPLQRPEGEGKQACITELSTELPHTFSEWHELRKELV